MTVIEKDFAYSPNLIGSDFSARPETLSIASIGRPEEIVAEIRGLAMYRFPHRGPLEMIGFLVQGADLLDAASAEIIAEMTARADKDIREQYKLGDDE